MILKQPRIQQPAFQRVLLSIVLGVAVLSAATFGWLWRNTSLAEFFGAEPIGVTPAAQFFESPQELTLKTDLDGTIRYTLDGTLPTASSTAYVQPISFDSSGVLLAAVFDEQQQLSKTQTHDVFIATHHTLPIVNVIIPPDSHWNDPAPVSANNDEWVTSGHVKYYEPTGVLGFQNDVTVQLHGKALLGSPQKSFRLEFIDEDGRETRIEYPLFGPEAPTRFSSLILRNDEARYARLREQVANQLVTENTSLDTQRGQPVATYINGQYWGLYFLRERFDETYFAEKYRVNPDALSVVEIPLGGAIKGQVIPTNKKSEDDAERFNRLITDTARCTDCVLYHGADNTLDMKNMIDYLFFEFYFANYDWPYNNYKAWRYQSPESFPAEADLIPQLDGRFRWLFYDSDVSFGAGRTTPEAMIKAAQGDPYAQLIDNAFPYRNLFYDYTFSKIYRARMTQLLNQELSPEYTDQVVDYWAEQIRPEMPAQIARWSQYNTEERAHSVQNMEEWELHVELLKLYLRTRPAAFQEHTERFFTP